MERSKPLDFLRSKKILIISPQPWSDMRISKHHYAIELSRRGNTVYFLNPPSADIKHGECILAFEPEPNVFVIKYRPLFPMRWKFILNRLFNFFMRFEAKKIKAAMGGSIDVVWDFEPNRQFADLRWFGKALKIYHPVDATPFINGDTKHANLILSVSDVILDYFKESSIPRYFINHGLGSAFAELAREQLLNLSTAKINAGKQLNFGYIGNLLMRYIDHDLFMQVIYRNPDVNFHIWGPHDYSGVSKKDPQLKATERFIEFLKGSSNVTLYGMQPHKTIVPAMREMDGFFWCYDNIGDPNKGSNSHKLLEYLSTGKVVVSTYVSSYKRNVDDRVIIMAPDRGLFINHFQNVISEINEFNSQPLMKSRIDLALNNSYQAHVEHIDGLVSRLDFK